MELSRWRSSSTKSKVAGFIAIPVPFDDSAAINDELGAGPWAGVAAAQLARGRTKAAATT
jgi:hypothetical protein